jgi:hypothetical protein
MWFSAARSKKAHTRSSRRLCYRGEVLLTIVLSPIEP